MTDRVVVHHDALLELLRGSAKPGLDVTVRAALRDWIEAGLDLFVAGVAWTAILDDLRARGWTAAEVAEAIHALDRLDLVTIEADRPTHLLVADAMERHGLAAAVAAAVGAGDLLGAPVASVRPAIAAAASRGILLGAAAAGPTAAATSPGSSSLPDYRGLGAFLGELRRRAPMG